MTTVGTMSGGAGSFAANWRWKEAHGTDDLRLVFTDVKGDCPNPYVGEDVDTYRFLVEASAAIFGRKVTLGAASHVYTLKAEEDVDYAYDSYPEMEYVKDRDRAVRDHAQWLYYRETAARVVPELLWLVEGRSIHDVFLTPAVGWLGNSRLSHCSWELKTKPTRRWMDDNCDPANTTVLVGMDWTETDRHPAVHHNYAHPVDAVCKRNAAERAERPCTDTDPCATRLPIPWRVQMPMNEKPRIAKPQVLSLVREQGIKPPRMYALGFAHSNCFACVKAGQAHWKKVLEVDPDLYRYMEAREVEFQGTRPQRATSTHLTRSEQRAGTTVSIPLPLTELRERTEVGNTGQLDLVFDHGGCSCGTGERPEEA